MKIIFITILLLASFSAKAELNLELPNLNLPDLGSSSNSFTSVQDRQLGLKILRKLRSSNQIIEDPEINLWIRSLGNRLVASAPRSSSPFYFLVSKDPSVNAFATMGGVIVINAGLILHTSTESELAAVLAHEIAHVTQQHISRMMEKAENNKFATNAALLAGIIAGSKDSQAGQAIIHATIATMAHKQLSFSREAESEADRVGIRILARAGFNPKGMPHFLAKLEQFNDDKYANVMEYLQNHPLTLKRVSDTQTRARQLGNFKGTENISYLFMREKIRALINSNLPSPTNTPENIKKYSKALQLKQRRNYPQALKLLGNSSRKSSEAIVIAQLLNKQRKYQQSINILNPLINIYPEDEALSIPLTQAYLGLGQVKNAWRLLNEINISEQTSLEFFEAFQEVARLYRKSSQAYRAAANRNIRIGAYKAASIQLRQAIKLPGANSNEILDMQQQLDGLNNK